MAKKQSKTNTAARVTSQRPIAAKVIKKLRSYAGAKLVDLSAVIEGKKNAEALQKKVASPEALADYHPAHALYIYAQNQASVMTEQLTALPELDRFTRLIGRAEEGYMPVGPPMSPITTSFFDCWRRARSSKRRVALLN